MIYERCGFVGVGVVGALVEALGGIYSVEVWHHLERCSRLLVLLSTGFRAESPCLVSAFEVMFEPLPRFHRLGYVCALLLCFIKWFLVD